MSRSLFRPEIADNEPAAYLNAIDGQRWDGSEDTAAGLDIRMGGVAVYETERDTSMTSHNRFTP